MLAFEFRGENIGFLLVHGFGGDPTEMMPLGVQLAGQGYHVVGVQLAGHGSDRHNAPSTSWQQWLESVHRGYESLASANGVRQIVICGHSTGSILALLEAIRTQAVGVVAIAPIAYLYWWQIAAIRILASLYSNTSRDSAIFLPVRRRWSFIKIETPRAYAELCKLLFFAPRHLHLVSVPVLIFRGLQDSAVPRDSAMRLSELLESTMSTVVVIPDGGHLMMMDEHLPIIEDSIAQFAEGVP